MKKFILLFILFFFICIINFAKDNNKVQFYVFISKQCSHCQDIIDLYIHPLIDIYDVEYKTLDLSIEENLKIFLNIISKKNINSNSAVSVLIGDELLTEKQIETSLEKIVYNFHINEGIKYPKLNTHNTIENLTKNHLISLKLPGAFIAGIIDGVNPCAFSTLLFFISYLLLLKTDKRFILKIGIIFISITFLTYLFIGFGIFQASKQLFFISTISNYILKITGIILLIFGLLSFYDFYMYKRNSINKMILQLSSFQKLFMHKVIRSLTKSKSLLFFSAVIAFIIAVTEFTCTGQIYIPVIMYALKERLFFNEAVYLLIVYNLGFILPLIMIFLFAYKGLTNAALSEILKNHIGLIKILSGCLFIIFGILFLL